MERSEKLRSLGVSSVTGCTRRGKTRSAREWRIHEYHSAAPALSSMLASGTKPPRPPSNGPTAVHPARPEGLRPCNTFSRLRMPSVSSRSSWSADTWPEESVASDPGGSPRSLLRSISGITGGGESGSTGANAVFEVAPSSRGGPVVGGGPTFHYVAAGSPTTAPRHLQS